MVKEKMTIGEFAKLKDITPEALRHYDRYDLLKLLYIDENTGYRFYSNFQFESRFQGIGLDEETLSFFIDYLIIKSSLNKIEIDTIHDNIRTYELHKNLGFKEVSRKLMLKH